MKKFILILLLTIFVLPVHFLFAEDLDQKNESQKEATQAQTRKIVKAIEVKGNKTIGIATILSKIKTKVGHEYMQSIISDDLKRLYNTGYFTSDTRVDREDYEGGFKVIFYVSEKPVVEKVTFSKTKIYHPKALKKKIKTKKGKFLDNKTLQDDIRTIEDLYAKKGMTLAEVNVEKEIDELTNKANIHFVIKEGKRIRVEKIRVNGNSEYSDKKIIRLIKTRSHWLFASGYLKEEVLEEDMERIKSFYELNGFIDATADFKYSEMGEGKLIVDINIYEGKQYFVDKVTVVGNKVVSYEEIRDVMKEIKVGGIFSRAKLTIDISNIRTLYFDKGYIFADVKESASLNAQTGKVAIKLEVMEGSLAYINQIKIQGNDRTKDIVIRRELRLFPGDRFDGAKLRRSKQRLHNLGYFEDIGYDVEDTSSPNRKDLVVHVKEAKTGAFSFGGGYSTVDQLIAFVQLEQKNFDITNWPTFTGAGQNLVLHAETGTTRNNMRLSFTEPWIMDYPISGGFDGYLSDREKDNDAGVAYDQKTVGGDLRLGKQFTEYVSGSVTYRWEKVDIGNFDADVSADLLAEEGENKVSSFTFSSVRDTRDSIFSPTRGWYLQGSAEMAGGALGGDKDFYRISTRTSYNIPLKFDSVLELRLRIGMVDAYGDSERVPIFERFFAGGGDTIRGYNEKKVGPLDATTEDPIGGESTVVGNVEYTVPLIEFIKFAAFFDIGNAWERVEDFGSGELKSGAGVGLRVKTPIGPVNLDYGYPLSEEQGEEERSGKFYFSVSRGF